MSLLPLTIFYCICSETTIFELCVKITRVAESSKELPQHTGHASFLLMAAINISPAKSLRCGDIFSTCFTANLLCNL